MATLSARGTQRIVSYLGVLHQALRDLSAWVEKGVEPPQSTNYKVVDGQVQVPPTAAERKGIQPVVTVKANGGARAEAAAGQPVTFTAVIDCTAANRTGDRRGMGFRRRRQLSGRRAAQQFKHQRFGDAGDPEDHLCFFEARDILPRSSRRVSAAG